MEIKKYNGGISKVPYSNKNVVILLCAHSGIKPSPGMTKIGNIGKLSKFFKNQGI